MNNRFILRQGTSDNLTATTLAQGELAYVTDTQELVVGVPDGYKTVTTLAVVEGRVVLPSEAPGLFVPVYVRLP